MVHRTKILLLNPPKVEAGTKKLPLVIITKFHAPLDGNYFSMSLKELAALRLFDGLGDWVSIIKMR